MKQPGGIAWNVYDERLHRLGLSFPDYRDASAAGAIVSAGTVTGLAARTRLPADALSATLADVERFRRDRQADPFGRHFDGQSELVAPYYAVKVTGALFHTQGGRRKVGLAQRFPFSCPRKAGFVPSFLVALAP